MSSKISIDYLRMAAGDTPAPLSIPCSGQDRMLMIIIDYLPYQAPTVPIEEPTPEIPSEETFEEPTDTSTLPEPEPEPDPPEFIGLTYAGVPLTKLISARSSMDICTEAWYLLAPPEGEAELLLSCQAQVPFIMHIMSLTGVHQETPFYFSTSIASSNTASIDFTLEEEAGNLIFGSGSSNMDVQAYVLPGQTPLWQGNYDNKIYTQAVTSVSTNTGTLAVPNILNKAATWVSIILNIKEA